MAHIAFTTPTGTTIEIDVIHDAGAFNLAFHANGRPLIETSDHIAPTLVDIEGKTFIQFRDYRGSQSTEHPVIGVPDSAYPAVRAVVGTDLSVHPVESAQQIALHRVELWRTTNPGPA